MLTVGYGDLKPNNIPEILVILVIQLFGIVMFGCIINEIGAHLSNLRRQNENLEKDLSNTEILAKSNKMNADLKERVREFVLTNQLIN